MKPSEGIELETVKDAFRLHFRTDPGSGMRREGSRVLIERDITHVVGLVDVHKKSVFGNGATAVYDLDNFLRAAAAIRDAYPTEELVIAFSDDDHWPCVLRPKTGQYGVAIAPVIPTDDNDPEQSGIAVAQPEDLGLKPREEEF